jgi:hypothetical protein
VVGVCAEIEKRGVEIITTAHGPAFVDPDDNREGWALSGCSLIPSAYGSTGPERANFLYLDDLQVLHGFP